MAPRGRGFRLAASRPPALARHSSFSRAITAIDDNREFWQKVAVFGGGFLFVFHVGKVFLDKEAELHKQEAERDILWVVSCEKDEEIARLEKAWEEEVAARQKQLERK